MAETTSNTQRKARANAASTRRSTAAKKAAGTRARRSAGTPKTARSAQTAARKTERKVEQVERNVVTQVQEAAEKAVLIPVGAALTAVDAVGELVETYSDRDKAERELKATRRRLERDLRKFERRGATARTKAEREVKRTRTRVERELRRRRTRAERLVKRNQTQVKRQAKDVQARAEQVQAQVENTVQTGVTAAEKAIRHRAGSGRDGRLATSFPRAAPRRAPAAGECCRPHNLAGSCSTLSSLNRRVGLRAGPSVLKGCAAEVPPDVLQSDVPCRCPPKPEVRKALEVVVDPELRQNIVELDMVRRVAIHETGVVDVTVSLTTPGCPIRNHFQTSVVNAVKALDGVQHVNVDFDVLNDTQKAAIQRSSAAATFPRARSPRWRRRSASARARAASASRR